MEIYIQIFDKDWNRWVTIGRTDDMAKARAILRTIAGARAISRTRLQREEGRASVRLAEADLAEIGVSNTIQKSCSRTVDYLLRDIPEAFHAAMKEEATKKGMTLREFIIDACARVMGVGSIVESIDDRLLIRPKKRRKHLGTPC